jgi:hypothetical protein
MKCSISQISVTMKERKHASFTREALNELKMDQYGKMDK